MPGCPFCEHENPAGADRCANCGAALTSIEETRDEAEFQTAPVADDSLSQTPQDRPTDELVGELVASGRKIEAIKLYRERTGASLSEAKTAVEAIEQGKPVVSADSAEREVTAFDAPLEQLLRDGKKIAAIKLYRERTGKGLKESKDAVEMFADEHGIPQKRIGCAATAILLLVIIVAACMYTLTPGATAASSAEETTISTSTAIAPGSSHVQPVR